MSATAESFLARVIGDWHPLLGGPHIEVTPAFAVGDGSAVEKNRFGAIGVPGQGDVHRSGAFADEILGARLWLAEIL